MPDSQFITYAQNGEDVLLWRALKHVHKGFYIDVGAQDPVNDSVTKAFYERGWHGINIEPVPRWYGRLVEDRPHDINLRLAVSSQPGMVTLFEVENSGLSTSDLEFARRHEAEGHVLHEVAVECKTLDQICADHSVGTVHFLKVDCEGAEKQVLEGASLSKTRPWIILVEATEPNSTKPTWHEWEHFLTERGYRFLFFDGLNRYYLAEEHMELASAFDAPANILDGMRRIAEVDAEAKLAHMRSEIEGLKGAAINARLQAEVAAAAAECDRVAIERDRAMAECDRLAVERDQMAVERDQMTVERDQMTVERDQATIERTRVLAECDRLAVDRNGLLARLDEVLASTSWRVTTPLRGASRVARRVHRWLRRVVVQILRRCARMARPILRRLSKRPLARKFVVGLLGRHSQAAERTRSFLYGTDRSGDATAARRKPAEDTEWMRRTLQSVLAELPQEKEDMPAAHGVFEPDQVMRRVRAEMAVRLARRLLP